MFLHTMLETICLVQQTLLIMLEDISASLINCLALKEDKINEINVTVLVECAKDGFTRNHIFLLISTVAKIIPNKVVDHIQDLYKVIRGAAVTEIDNHSRHVFEDLISTVWLQGADYMDKLLLIFMDVLPDVADHRSLSIVLYLLRYSWRRKQAFAACPSFPFIGFKEEVILL